MKTPVILALFILSFNVKAQKVPTVIDDFPFVTVVEEITSPSRADFSWEVLYARIDDGTYTMDILQKIEETADSGLEMAAKISSDFIYRYSYESEGIEGLIFVNEETLSIEITSRQFGILKDD